MRRNGEARIRQLLARPRMPAEPSAAWVGGHHCKAPECSKATREQKPFCSDHVLDRLAYPAALKADVESRLKLTEGIAKKKKKARANDPHAEEILEWLAERGRMTVERLARELQLPSNVVTAYVKVLKRAKKVDTGSTSRGNTTAALRQAG